MTFDESQGPDDSGADRYQADLTPPSLFELTYHAPPAQLAQLITTLYHFRCDETEIRDIQPAAVGHVMVFLRGSGVMRFPDGHIDPSHPVSLMTPCSAAVPVEVDGPFHCIGAALSPLGWAAFTGLHAARWADRLLPAQDHLGQDLATLGDSLIAAYGKGATGVDLCEKLAQFLGIIVRPVNPRHAALMAGVADWLGSGFDPDLDDLFARSAYSRRQTQRLVERYFGLPPSALKRKYRALRVVALLAQAALSEEDVHELEDCFYDQSHMIREIRHFAGRTPGYLAEDGDSILSALLDIRNFREIPPSIAPLPERYNRE